MHATSWEGSRKGENLVYISTYHCAGWCQGRLDTHICPGVEWDTAVHTSIPPRTGLWVVMAYTGLCAHCSPSLHLPPAPDP